MNCNPEPIQLHVRTQTSESVGPAITQTLACQLVQIPWNVRLSPCVKSVVHCQENLQRASGRVDGVSTKPQDTSKVEEEG